MGALLGKVLNYHTNAYYDCLEGWWNSKPPSIRRCADLTVSSHLRGGALKIMPGSIKYFLTSVRPWNGPRNHKSHLIVDKLLRL